MKKRFIVEKCSTSDDQYYSDTDSASLSDTHPLNTETEQAGGRAKFTSIADTNYKKPRGGSRQDNLSTDEIKKKLEGYIPLRTMKDKKVLASLPYYKTWVRYINNETTQFRTGGLLMKVVYPDYIMLANTKKNITWSVQLKDNTIFIRDPKLIESKREQEAKQEDIKEKLYKMYQRGQLKAVKK